LIFSDLTWATGLFEGEGCISLERAGTKKASWVRNVRLAVVSTDRDVLDRFHEIVSCGRITEMNGTSNLGTKQRWVWRLSRQEDVAALLNAMYPMLGNRRQEAARRVLAYINRDRSDERIVRVDL
jgi:hypothetical protein